jgi:uncharacterized protein (TIGR03382 family)
MTCEDVDCSPTDLGACCTGEQCSEISRQSCEDNGGVFNLDATCEEGICIDNPETGACCLPDESCEVLTADECDSSNGDWSEGVGCAVAQCSDDPVDGDATDGGDTDDGDAIDGDTTDDDATDDATDDADADDSDTEGSVRDTLALSGSGGFVDCSSSNAPITGLVPAFLALIAVAFRRRRNRER